MGFITRVRRTVLRSSSGSLCSNIGAFLIVIVIIHIIVVLAMFFRSSNPGVIWRVPKMALSQSDNSILRDYPRPEPPAQLLPYNVSMEAFWNGDNTGNPLIDLYGANNVNASGEIGRGVVLTVNLKAKLDQVINDFRINTLVSDIIPLNRMVPDSRIDGCSNLTYNDSHLPKGTVIIPFYNEWPSLLLRTVYSIVNRTPRHLLREILLIDDASTLVELQGPLKKYLYDHFPRWLVRLIRCPERKGLINARMRGVRESKGDVLIFFDSHMEVNIEWLPPLLTEIVKDRRVVAMSTLDYIQYDTLEYRYNINYLTRYVWDWRMVFFETFFRQDQVTPTTTSPRPGAAMVGAAFAVEKNYFLELGGYDEGMGVWGGENLEMSWRVWLCGGRLVHLPCSRIGHVARAQPYSFPGGRQAVEHFNYKRAVKVWMGQYARFVYHIHPDMKNLDVGDLSDRYAIKKRLNCKDFGWYLQNVWPELNVYDENVTAWGSLINEGMKLCLDNGDYLFQAQAALFLKPCTGNLYAQGFSLKTDNRLRTSLQCVVSPDRSGPNDREVGVEDCLIGIQDRWTYTEDHNFRHHGSGLCLDVGAQGPILASCKTNSITQKWKFIPLSLDKNVY